MPIFQLQARYLDIVMKTTRKETLILFSVYDDAINRARPKTNFLSVLLLNTIPVPQPNKIYLYLHIIQLFYSSKREESGFSVDVTFCSIGFMAKSVSSSNWSGFPEVKSCSELI